MSEKRGKNYFWQGSPEQGVTPMIRRRCRGQYHYVINNIRRNKDDNQVEKMAVAIAKNSFRVIWTEVKRSGVTAY